MTDLAASGELVDLDGRDRVRTSADDVALRAQLVERFRREIGDRVRGGDIDQLVDEAIASFGSARVRTFIPILASRRARAHIRASASASPAATVDDRVAVTASDERGSPVAQAADTVLLNLAAGQFLMALDSSVMNVSIATVANDLAGGRRDEAG